MRDAITTRTTEMRTEQWPLRNIQSRENLLDVYDNKKWGGIFEGSYNQKFEEKFSQYNNVKYCATLTSGTAGLVLSLLSLNIGEGDEVIVPAMSFVATATCVSIVKAIPVFVDINKDTNCIDINAVKNAISRRTKAIIAVHIGGQVCDMNALLDLSNKFNIPIIEDCAQAIGAERDNKKVGTFGKMGVFSFAQTKNLVCGEGGAVITNDSSIIEKIRRLRNHGRSMGMQYWHEYLGGNYRLSEFQAAILIPQIDTLDDYLQRKNIFAKKLTRAISELNYGWISTEKECDGVNLHGYYSYVLYYHKDKFNNIDKSLICNELRRLGVPVGKSDYTPGVIQDNPIYKSDNKDCYHNIQYDTPIAREKYSEMIVLGQAVGSSIMLGNEEDINFIIKQIKEINKLRYKLM